MIRLPCRLGTFLSALLACGLCVGVASACLVCSVPYQSLLDKLESDTDAVVARMTGLEGTAWQVEEVIIGTRARQGQLITTRLAAEVSTKGQSRLLRWNQLGKFWMEEGPADPEFLDFAFRVIQSPSKLDATGSLRSQTEYFRYFVTYLEHSNPLIADAAHARIAGAPYEVLRELGDQFTPERLLDWIDQQPVDVVPEQRRDPLYITLLGICGGESELEMTSRWISRRWITGRSDQLGAILTAHGELNGESTVELIEQQYILDRDRTLEEITEAVNALRVHGQANRTISRERVLAAYRLLLRHRKPLLELVVSDCRRWQDWSVAPMLIDVYSSGAQPWTNSLILEYLRACPLPEAQRFIAKYGG